MKTEKPDITLKYKDNAGKMEWTMQAGAGKPEKGPGNYDKLVVGQGDNGIFTFAIKTNGIKFDPANPIEIKLAGTGTDMSDQFMHKIVDETVLIVADPNSDQVPTEYYYKLNFQGAGPLDPIITNGCCKTLVAPTEPGGIQLMSIEGAIAVLLAAAVLAAVFTAVVRQFR